MLVNYKGKLGDFEYDDSEFKVITEIFPKRDRLIYIGEETDGSKIVIPEGVTDTSFLFADNKKIRTGVTIPDSVTSSEYMYMDCTELEIGSDLSEGIIFADGMYQGCTKLKTVPVINSNLWADIRMFAGCSERIKAEAEWAYCYRGKSYEKDGPVITELKDGFTKHYNGRGKPWNFGEFDFDTRKFQITYFFDGVGTPCQCNLSYIGNEEDIQIPKGLKRGLFISCDCQIPKGLERGLFISCDCGQELCFEDMDIPAHECTCPECGKLKRIKRF